LNLQAANAFTHSKIERIASIIIFKRHLYLDMCGWRLCNTAENRAPSVNR